MIKKILVALIFFLTMSHAQAAASLEEAEIRLVCAICSMSAYSDDESYLIRSMLTERNWTIEKISRKSNRAYTKAYLVSKGDVKILSVAGTESIKDVEIDFRVGRVHLNDNSPPLNAYDEKNSGDKLFVHRGFRDYADLVLSDGLAERLTTSLAENPNETLYLTGHSLGGAVAIIAGIRLTDKGVPKSQLKVITFGSPAVGSKALAKNYADSLDLTRVVMRGDVIKKSLRVLGYVQFGETLNYRQSATSNHTAHKMSVYLDCALRDYFEAGGNLRHEVKEKIDTPIFAAPIFVLKGSLKSSDKNFILNVLNDTLANNFGNVTFAAKQSIEFREKNFLDEDFDEFVTAAREQGCQYVLIRILRAKKNRDAPLGDTFVTLEEIILDTNGLPLNMQTSGASTEDLTLLEATLSAQENLNDNLKNFFSK